jgi:PAS domain S-box-containing protein
MNHVAEQRRTALAPEHLPTHPRVKAPAGLSRSARAAQSEALRLRALHDLQVLDSAPEQLFDDIAALAAQVCGTPIALISLVDEQRQWFKARVGLAAQETPRDVAFCAHAIQAPSEVMVVPDALLDGRFASNPLVNNDPSIRFYAGAPIVTDDGLALGTVCAIDRQPRELSSEQLRCLQALARQAAQLLRWRHRALEQARQLQHHLLQGREDLRQATALSASALGLHAYIDTQYIYRFVNDEFLDYWGLQRSQIEDHTVSDLLGAEVFNERVKPMLDRALAGENVSYSAPFDYPRKGRRQMSVSYLPVRNAEGAVCAVVVRAQDIQDIEQARAELESANHVLRQQNDVQQRFIHMMSHDIREPVNTICNFAGLLQEDHAPQLDDEGRQYLAFIRQGGERMRVLLDDLLAYVHLESTGTGLLKTGAVDLNDLFEQVLVDLNHALDLQHAQLSPAPLPCVLGDATLLRVLFQNLLSNALKFHAPGKVPQVRWGWSPATSGMASVWVEDSGIGMDRGQQDRLFAPFSRLVTRRQFEGTGLGLATCKRIAELHGGSISIQSEPGDGSRFTVMLPLAAEKRHD